MWNCTHFRQPTDEQLRHVDIYFLVTKIICSLSTLNSITGGQKDFSANFEALPGGGGSHVARLNFKMSRAGVYKCLLLIVGFAVTVAIWPREVVSCRNFILRSVATFSAMSLVGIYPGRASTLVEHILLKHFQWIVVSPLVCRCVPDCHVR